MIIKKIKRKTRGYPFGDNRARLIIEIMSETTGHVKKFDVADGEPEDSNLMRDFSDCYSVPELLEFAFKCGQEDANVTIIEEESEEI